jgi:predicted  nucleic acid-binding Zn-ribbon protein
MPNWLRKLSDKANPGEIKALELQIRILKEKRDFVPKQIALLEQEKANLPRQINALEKQLDYLRRNR